MPRPCAGEKGDFNPRSPRGERPTQSDGTEFSRNFNPRSPRGERRDSVPPCRRRRYFNPRSPRGERQRCTIHPKRRTDFNPRSPRGERLTWTLSRHTFWGFQSTLPSRGATRNRFDTCLDVVNFNPRSPRGERLPSAQRHCHNRHISIHAPLAGSDLCKSISVIYDKISIHAPLAGSDSVTLRRYVLSTIISIHAPLAGSDNSLTGCRS